MPDLCGWFAAKSGGCATVRLLAYPFAARPEYDPAWAMS